MASAPPDPKKPPMPDGRSPAPQPLPGDGPKDEPEA